ncbi:hypothetical protein B4Q13_21675 [Lacticaseibacillus rhamnosus]
MKPHGRAGTSGLVPGLFAAQAGENPGAVAVAPMLRASALFSRQEFLDQCRPWDARLALLLMRQSDLNGL